MSTPFPSSNPPAGTSQPAAAPAALKWLWGAVGALTLAVLALGGTLIAQQHKAASEMQAREAVAERTPESEVIEEKAPQSTAQQAQSAPSEGASAATDASAPAATSKEATPAARTHVAKAVRPAHKAAPQTAAESAAPPTPVAPIVAAGPAPQPVPVAPVCAVCGRVEAVRPIQKSAPATGLGAVAGGVLGAVLGNQIGGGSGRAVATVAGAVGGGYLGNTIEKKTRTETTYDIVVRMDDGSVRHFHRAQAVAVGTPVVVEGGSFRLADGAPAQ